MSSTYTVPKINPADLAEIRSENGTILQDGQPFRVMNWTSGENQFGRYIRLNGQLKNKTYFNTFFSESASILKEFEDIEVNGKYLLVRSTSIGWGDEIMHRYSFEKVK